MSEIIIRIVFLIIGVMIGMALMCLAQASKDE